MDLKDIPDRWKRFDPETPPYKFWPNRTRSQTLRWSWMALIGCTAGGYILYLLMEKNGEAQEEKIREYARSHASIEQLTQVRNQQEALQGIFMKARRERLGLPGQVHGSVEIRDPDDFTE
mmetsp:Transcript_41803/g.108282  ORF Transcript_41803/g.108282 Transcript_41803/m.108282 type:complete len:120 (-) Transcript_41803:87-446(-)